MGLDFPTTSAVVLCLAAAAIGTAPSNDANVASRQADPSSQVRALWVTRTTLTSRASIERMVAAAERAGFNTLVVQVRGRGDAYYRSTIEPRAADLAASPSFDPLADTLTLAHRAGMKVHAWIAVNLISSAINLPSSRQHLIHRQPDWLMVPGELASELSAINPRTPSYLRRLASWTRAHSDEVEGLYVSPIHPWAVTHLVTVATELVRAYNVDGLHLDYVRYPGDNFDYSRAALQQFKSEIRPQLSSADRRRADALDRKDLLAYPKCFPNRWRAFRQLRLTTLVTRLRAAVKAVRPHIVLSAAVLSGAKEAVETHFQDWGTWLNQSLLDAVCPMIYTVDTELFARELREVTSAAGDRPVWAGIGAYQLPPAQTIEQIATARRLEAAGIILFSYDALAGPPHNPSTLTQIGRAAFGSMPH